MQNNVHPLSDLFAQLGLASDAEAIEHFVRQHSQACKSKSLLEAPIWSPSQLAFLREAIAQDAEWSLAADSLLARLSA